MIQLISGEKGKGKTKVLLSKANELVQNANGNIVFLDKSNRHMYELNNKIRLINVQDYLITNVNEFVGFISGLISQDHDLEKVFCDGFLKVAHISSEEEVREALTKLDVLSEQFGVDMVISICITKEDIPEMFKDNVIVAL